MGTISGTIVDFQEKRAGDDESQPAEIKANY